MRRGFFFAAFLEASAFEPSGVGTAAAGASFARRFAASAREIFGTLGIVLPIEKCGWTQVPIYAHGTSDCPHLYRDSSVGAAVLGLAGLRQRSTWLAGRQAGV